MIDQTQSSLRKEWADLLEAARAEKLRQSAHIPNFVHIHTVPLPVMEEIDKALRDAERIVASMRADLDAHLTWAAEATELIGKLTAERDDLRKQIGGQSPDAPETSKPKGRAKK